MGTDKSEGEPDLVDVSDMPLEKISQLPESVLAESLSRILADDSGSPDWYAAFQNAL